MRWLKDFLKSVKTWLQFQRESYLDGYRHYRSTPVPGRQFRHVTARLEGDIVRRYHVIEKGLSMPEFRPRFGQPIVSQLVEMIRIWDETHRNDCRSNHQIEAARATLHAYRRKHQELGVDISDILKDPNEGALLDEDAKGGVRRYQTPPHEDRQALVRMLHARCSVRHFDSSLPPDRAAVERAVSMAIRSPSVCNRQTWRAHLYEGRRAQEVLSLQDGNRGFGHTVPAVIVVTSDLRYFGYLYERYQGWIDGGMFAMSLLLGLQAEGFGAVALNWCVLNERDEHLRRVAEIPDYERIVMIIGFGHPAEGCLIPVSQRRPVSSILRVHV